ncbi:MAG: GAF domain-containing protein [Anaerolineae bacterium]|nr:GAF domain-containing protein [Anaerolineae bacterium]
MHNRVMRLLIPLVMGISVVVGVLMFFVLRSADSEVQFAEHRIERETTAAALNAQIEHIVNEVRIAGTSRTVRSFARETLVATASSSLETSQTALLGELTGILSNQSDIFMAARYVTFNGSVWSEVTKYDNLAPLADNSVRLNALADETTIVQALLSEPGSVIAGNIEFASTEETLLRGILLPYVRFSTPVVSDNDLTNVAGVLQFEVRIDGLIDYARTLGAELATESDVHHIILADNLGHVLVDSHHPEVNYLADLEIGSNQDLGIVYPQFAGALNPGAEIRDVVDGATLYSVERFTLGNAGATEWRMVLVESLFGTNGLVMPVGGFFASLLVGVVVLAVTNHLLKNTFQSFRSVQIMAKGLVGEGSKLSPLDAELVSESGDDIGEVMRALQSLSGQIDHLSTELSDQRLRYTRSMDIAGRISRETAALYDIDTLLNRAINLIVSSYGFYHAQVFLVDDIGQNAILYYSYGEVGQKLLDQRHKIPIGSESVIGTVTSGSKPVVINDTSRRDEGIAHRYNPLLPETRAEMAIPLRIGDQVIGALDIQSDHVNAFQDDDVRTFQMLADQIAIAIQNVRLLVESETRVEQIDTLNRQLTRGAWEEAGQRSNLTGIYRYDLLTVERTEDVPADVPGGVSVPISIRGETIGTLDAAMPDGSVFTDGDQAIMRAVADRVAIAIENARLFEQSQSTLAETYTLYQLSRYLNEANSLEDIVQAIIISVMPDASSGQIGVFDEYAPGHAPEWMIISADWTATEKENREVKLTELELHIPDHPLFASMNSTQVTLITDTERDTRIDEVTNAIVQSAKARSMVLIPFNVRGVWRGLVMIQFPQTREFSERDGRIYTALIDQAGVAIDNRMLLSQNEAQLHEIERLYTGSRIINMAQNFVDLVRAAVNTANDPTLDFAIGVFEGALDPTGWPTAIRVMASSHGSEIATEDTYYDLHIPADSPLRRRDAQIVQDRGLVNGDDLVSSMLALARSRGYQFTAAFPLYSINQPIALFFIQSTEGRDLSNEDFEIYRALTGQMSTVLQNRRLLEQTERALDETRRLYAASRAIATAADAQNVFAALATHLNMAGSNVARVVVMLAGPTQVEHPDYVEYAYVWSPTNASSDLTVGKRIARSLVDFTAVLAEHDGVARLNDLRRDLAAHPALIAVLERSGSHSAALTAISSRQRWYGVIMVESSTPNSFSTAYGTFMRVLTDQVSVAVESIQSFEEAQTQAQRALALAEAGQLTARIEGEFTTGFGEVFARVAQPAKYDRWLLLLRADRGTALETITDHMPLVSGHKLEVVRDEYPVMQAYHTSQTVYVNNPFTYPAFTDEAHVGVAEAFGKHLATPVRIGTETIGVLLVGRSIYDADLDERDEQLVSTLAAQVAITIENRRLFTSAEGERARLRTVLDTLPAGVLVLDPVTFKPLQFNQQVEHLLNRTIDFDTPFSVDEYGILQGKSNSLYETGRLPIYSAAHTGVPAFADDLSVERSSGERIDLLVNAAPIVDAQGNVTAIVTAFQDVSPLRKAEAELEENLRESVSQYETTRALAEADDIETVLEVAFAQLLTTNPEQAYALLLDDQGDIEIFRASDEERIGDEWTLPLDMLDARQLLIVPDVAAHFTDPHRQTILSAGIGAFVAMPLQARSRRNAPLGWLLMTYSQANPNLTAQARFLTTLNDGASVALDNRYLLRDTESALNETAALYGATTSISRAQTQADILRALQESLASQTPDIYAGYIFEAGTVRELFNVSLDGPPIPFGELITRHGLLDGKTTYVEELRTRENPNAFEQELLALGNIRSFALIYMPGSRGCLITAYHQPRLFSRGEQRYLSAVADSSSIVIANTLLLDQIRTTLDETSILYEASRALSNAGGTDEILDVVVAHLTNRPVTQVFLATLLSSDWESPEALAQVVSSWHREGENVIDLTGITLMAEQYPAWKLLAAQNVVMIDDVEIDEMLDDNERIGVQSLEMRSISILPLRVAGRSIGAIVLGSSEPYTHTERDLRIYRSFAEQASLRMEASRLLGQTERRARQLATSTQVSQIASSILDLNDLLPKMVDIIRDSFYYDHVQVFLMDGDDEFAELRASTGEAGHQLLSIRHKLSKGSASVIGQVTERGEPIVALDTADARVVHRPNPYLPNTRSEMAVPLKLKGRVVGALDVQSNQPNAFDDDDVTVLTTLAGQIAVAIDNAQLFEESSRRADEMAFLFDVTSRAAAAESLQGAIQNVADELRDSLESLSVSIYLPQTYVDADENTFTVLQPIALAGSDQPLTELSEVRLDESFNLIASSANNRRAMILNNVENESRYIPVVAGARSAVIVPLSSGAALIGLIAMESEQLNAYNNDTLTLLRTLSGTLSAIIQNRQLLEQVQKTNDQLRELDRLKSDFLANMSHELRTPLNSIIGFSRVILKGIDGPLTEMQEQDLSTIYNSGLHLLNLINDILDQAKIAAGKMDLQLDYFEMKPVIDGVRSIGIGLVKDKPIDIVVDLAPGLQPVFGDEFRTRQILLNLVSNAAKFTREGAITIHVYPMFDPETGRQMVRTDVTDTGIGIAEADIPLLFEAFRQVDSSLTRTAGGTGLGLPIAKSLCEMQGGRMEVQSRVNYGSTFSIFIPVEPIETDEKKKSTDNLGAEAEPESYVEEAPTQPRVTGLLPAVDTNGDYSARPPMHIKRQILIIEDNPDMVDQIRRALGREGFDIYSASLPLEAEAMAGGLHPTLIVMDVNFANGQGWNILEKLKSRDDMSDIPVVVVSLSQEVERALNGGVFRFISRPFMPEDLVDAVRAAEQESRINRILIIDDQPESVRLLEQLLDQNGNYRVFSANTGMDGISLVARRRPDLVILDLRMPEMDGFDVVRELRSNPETATIPILIVTGETLNPQERESLTNLNVLYKSEISTDSYRLFLEGVKAYLDSKN